MNSASLRTIEPEEVTYFRQEVLRGTPWYQALLETIARWALPEEEVHGRRYVYLLLGEAFDWLTLVERLLSSTDGLVQGEECDKLLFEGRLPDCVDEDTFRRTVGEAKYIGILNFWYGVVVEEALQIEEEEKRRKERRGLGRPEGDEVVEEAFQRLYGERRSTLLCRFRQAMGYPSLPSITLTEMKEFTYWLFKRRVASSEPALVASDTRRGLAYIHALRNGQDPY